MPAPQTELEAINSILSAAGEAKVAALGTADSEQAELILDETSTEVQGLGWYFNKRYRTFTVSGGQVAIPTEILSIDPERADLNYVIRGGYLFDMRTGLDDDFTQDITLLIVELLDWTDLPSNARNFIQKRAARLYLERITGDAVMAARAAQTEEQAHALLRRDHIKNVNARIFSAEQRRFIDKPQATDRIW